MFSIEIKDQPCKVNSENNLKFWTIYRTNIVKLKILSSMLLATFNLKKEKKGFPFLILKI